VEKIKRDVKILTIYEGTSEIQRNIISMFRLRETVRSKGGFYSNMASGLADMDFASGGPFLARAIRVMNQVILITRRHKLTKSQHVMFLLADMMTWAEVASAFCQKAETYEGGQTRTPAFMKGAARLFVREMMEKIYINGSRIAFGAGEHISEMAEVLDGLDMAECMEGHLYDMNLIAAELVG